MVRTVQTIIRYLFCFDIFICKIREIKDENVKKYFKLKLNIIC